MAKPIKRSKYIIQLSREHHFSLLFCWKIRTGIKKGIDPDRIIPYALYFWAEHLLPHFSEEDILFERVDDELVRRAYSEHHEINELAKQISTLVGNDSKVVALSRLANLVEEHVRFEERELFPHLEKALEESELAEVGRKLLEIQPEPLQDTYPDEFWKES